MKKVLIVDDDSAVTNYFMVFLMQTDLFEPTVINDSRQVEDILANDEFDVIMLDLDMPNVTGMDILKMMRAKGLKIPVVKNFGFLTQLKLLTTVIANNSHTVCVSYKGCVITLDAGAMVQGEISGGFYVAF